MKSIVAASAILAACLISGGASAAKKCTVVGTWTDTVAGASATFTTNKRGSASIAAACPSTYKLLVTTLTNTTWDITGTAKKCPTVTAALTFTPGGCTQASGTVTIPGIGSIPDTFNKTAAIKTHEASRSNPLASGIK
jgi:hypothetical protein